MTPCTTKFYTACICVIMAYVNHANAQSQSYQIETLSKPEKFLPTVTSDGLYKGIEKNFLKLSITGNVVELGTHPVIAGYLKAYQNHYPLTVSPDIAWLLICQGFANHINQNPEQFRAKLAGFSGKKTLTINRDATGVDGIKNMDWETIFPEFTKQIANFTGKKLIDNLTADFTTTTPTTLVTSQITIMESVKEFFNYKIMITGCGISEVTVEGNVKDWEKILIRLDYLAGYDLKWWTDELKPVIQKIIDTKKGKVDKQFWMNMVKYHKLGVYGSYDGIDGWLLKFYPYLRVTQAPVLDKQVLAGNGPPNILLGQTNDESQKTKTLHLYKSEFREIQNINDLPKELSNVPFILEIKDKMGNIKQSFNMEFWAGFMAVKQDPETYNIKPEIGWAINFKPEKK